MAAAAVLQGGSCCVLAYPVLLAAMISSPAMLPDVPAAAGTQPPSPSPLAAGLWARSKATFTRTKQFPVRGYREIVRKMAARAVSPL